MKFNMVLLPVSYHVRSQFMRSQLHILIYTAYVYMYSCT